MNPLSFPGLCPLLLCLLMAPVMAAEDPEFYDVEVVIFSNPDADSGGEELLVTAQAAPSQDASLTATGMDTTLNEPVFSTPENGLHTLDAIRAALTPARGYRVLAKLAWRQPGLDREHAQAYPVHGTSGPGLSSLDGTITLIRERYLHLAIDLSESVPGAGAADLYGNPTAAPPAYRLTESRRIRSGELHYFDHPRLGVIARVTPVQAVPDLQPADSEATLPLDSGEEEEAPAPPPPG